MGIWLKISKCKNHLCQNEVPAYTPTGKEGGHLSFIIFITLSILDSIQKSIHLLHQAYSALPYYDINPSHHLHAFNKLADDGLFLG